MTTSGPPSAPIGRGQRLLQRLSELFDPHRSWGGERDEDRPEGAAAKLAQVPALVTGFMPVIDRNLNLSGAVPCAIVALSEGPRGDLPPDGAGRRSPRAGR